MKDGVPDSQLTRLAQAGASKSGQRVPYTRCGNWPDSELGASNNDVRFAPIADAGRSASDVRFRRNSDIEADLAAMSRRAASAPASSMAR